MAVKSGYKLTDVGVIPNDWEVVSLPNALDFISGKAHEQYVSEFGLFTVVNSKFISSDGTVAKYSSRNFCPARSGDVLMVMSDLPNGKALAKCFIVECDNKYAVNQRVCILRPKKGISKFFAYQLSRNPYFLAFNDGVSQTHLLNGVFRACPVIVPPLPEQQAIANALSDVDQLIASLTQLIAKKRDLKQAAMQQLLTGKTRLQGFSGEWETVQLGQIATIRSGGTPSTTQSEYWDGDVPWCTPTDITALSGRKFLKKTARTITTAGLSNSSAEMIDAMSVIMTSRATIGECAINLVPVSTNQGFKNFVPSSEVKLDFLYYFLASQKQNFIQLCSGSTFLEINKRQLQTYPVRLPSTVEQDAIGAILSDVDTELTELEQRRDKTIALKQGMMQELLTGKTRLV